MKSQPVPTQATVRTAAAFGCGLFHFRLATGSPGELGLLQALGDAFGSAADATLDWVKAGTGQSLHLLQTRQVDMAMVHAPAEVNKALAEGWATGKTLIGCNEFYIVGPASDPADIASAQSVTDAYRRIAEARATFVSRGDNSGTHQKEMQIWTEVGIQPELVSHRDWYILTRDFMTASLKVADGKGAYFMTDSSTWIMEQRVAPALKILFRGDRSLVNTYHAIVAPPGATEGRDTAAKFIDFVASPAGQKIIREYGAGQYPEALYNDATYAKKFD